MGRVSDQAIDLQPPYGLLEPDDEPPSGGDDVGLMPPRARIGAATGGPADTRSFEEIVAELDASIPF